MSRKSQYGKSIASDGVLRWPGGIVTADTLRESLNGERELVVTPRTVITPLAADHLKANGVKVIRDVKQGTPQSGPVAMAPLGWAYVQERVDPIVGSVIQSLNREEVKLSELTIPIPHPPNHDLGCGLAREVAQCVLRGDCRGAVVVCSDPGLACCVANKVKGVRAVSVHSGAQAARAVKGLAVNFLGLEIGKLTFFEMRQILRCVCSGQTGCPTLVAEALKELEGPCGCRKASGVCDHPGAELPGSSLTPPAKCSCGGGHAHR